MRISDWSSDVCSSDLSTRNPRSSEDEGPGRSRKGRTVGGLPNEKGRGLEPSGRLELTWTNKHLRLISDPEGGYEWVEPTDPRVSEVRPLQEVGHVGDDAPDAGNLLIAAAAHHAPTPPNPTPPLPPPTP